MPIQTVQCRKRIPLRGCSESARIRRSTDPSESRTGHPSLEVLKWVVEHGCPWDATDCALHAYSRGHMVTWRWCSGSELNRRSDLHA